jgi:hypothetical protein
MPSELYGVTTRKIISFVVTVVKASDPKSAVCFSKDARGPN